MIELKEIEKSYDTDAKICILKKVSLTIERGEMTAIMGRSGSGKSTLLHILGTLDTPTKGEYWFNKTNITHMQGKQLSSFRNKSIGFIFQSYFLLSSKTAVENVMLPLLYTPDFQGNAKKEATDILFKVGMGERLYHKPAMLSGGQCQRVAIARALVNKPEIILADEPTGALDSATAKSIMSLLNQLNEAGQTIIIVTHDEVIGKNCKRCIHIDDGKIKKVN